MSEEMKNGAVGTGQAPESRASEATEPTIADKLNEASSAMARADAELKARRAQDRKKKTESSRAEKQKAREAEQKRLEDEEKKQQMRQRRLAQLAYAENYREKQREEQQRRAAARDAKRKATKDAMLKKQEEEAEARLLANEAEAQSAEQRNAENDELLRKYSESLEAELARREQLAEDARERSSREVTSAPRGPIIISEDGKELLAAIEPELIYKGVDLSALDALNSRLPSEMNDDGKESPEVKEAPEAKEAPVTEDAPTEAPEVSVADEAAAPKEPDKDLPTYSGIDLSALAGLGAPLSSEGALEGYLDDIAAAANEQNEAPTPEKPVDKAPTPKKEDTPDDYIISLDAVELIPPTEPKLIGTRKIEKEAPVAEQPPKAEEVPATEQSPKAEEAPKKANEPNDFIISIPSTQLIAPTRPVPEKAKSKKAESAPAPKVKRTVKTKKTIKKRTVTKTAPAQPVASAEPIVVRIYDSKSDRSPELNRFLRGYGTYKLVTTKAGFSDDVSERKKNLKDEMTVPASDGEYATVREPDELSDDYEFSAGFVYTYEALGLVDKKKEKRDRKERIKQMRKDMKRAKYGLPPLYAVVADDAMPDEVDEGKINDGESLTEAAVAATAISTAAAALALADRKQNETRPDNKEEAAEDIAPAYTEKANAPEYVPAPTGDDSSASGIAAAAVGTAMLTDAYRQKLDETEALKARRDELAAGIAESEKANRSELDALQKRKNDAIIGAYQSDIDSINDKYAREIEQLTAKKDQLQSSYEAERARIEESISEYVNPYSEDGTQHVEVATRGTDGNHVVTVAYSDITEPSLMPERYSLPEGESDEKRALAMLAAGETEDKIVTKMNKRELKDRLRRADAKEAKLKKSYAKVERKRIDSTERLVSLMTLKRELLESYVQDLNFAIVAENSKYMKKYARLVSETTGEYNGLIDDFCVLTGSKTPTVNENIAELIVSGVGCPPIPVINYAPKDSFKQKTSPKREAAERLREQKQLLKDDKRLRRDIKAGVVREQEAPDLIALTPKMVKKMMKLDLKTVKARAEYRKSGIKYQLSLSNYHFNENTRASQKRRADSNEKLRAMRRDTSKLLKVTKANNKRYATVCDGVKLNRVKHEAERERLALLRQRIIAQIVERAEINTRLMALYSDDGRGKKNVRDKIAHVRLKAARRSFKKQLRLYRKSRKYFVPLTLKEETWALMNERTDLCAYLAECKYRKKHEKPRGSLKRALKEEIRNTKKNIKYTERDIYHLMHRMKKKNEKQPNIKSQLIWLIVLAILVVGVVAAVVFRAQIAELVVKLIASLTGK